MSDEPTSADTRKRGVALRYGPGVDAPTVVAKGYGTAAENIISMAREHEVYIHESPELVGLLMQINLDEQIPPALYSIVAELLAWLYSLEGQAVKPVGEEV